MALVVAAVANLEIRAMADLKVCAANGAVWNSI